MSFLDTLIYGVRDIYSAGVAVTRRNKLNFGTGLVASDNPTTGATDVIVSGGTPTGTGVRKVVGGVEDAAASLILNADVNAAAAIAGTKIDPDFGAQSLTTTGNALLGATPRASAGHVRGPSAFSIKARNAGNSANLNVISTDAGDVVEVGGTGVGGVAINGGSNASGFVQSGNYTFLAGYGGANHTALPIIGDSAVVSPYGVHGTGPQAMANADQTPAATVIRNGTLRPTGSNTAIRTMTIPAATAALSYYKLIDNQCTGYAVKVTTGSGSYVNVPPGWRGMLLVDENGVSAAGGDGNLWTVATDVDLTAVSLVTAVANGALVAGGVSYEVENFAGSSVMSIGGADGMRIKAGLTNTTFSPVSRTGPIISTPVLSTLTGKTGSDWSLRATVWLKSENLSIAAEEVVPIWVGTRSAVARYEFARIFSGGAKSDFTRLVNNSQDRGSTTHLGWLASNDVFQLEIPSFGADYCIARTGIYSSGWPSTYNVRGTQAANSGTWKFCDMKTIADVVMSFGIGSHGVTGVLEAKIGRYMLEYRRN